MLTFKFSATVSATPQGSSTTSDASSVTPSSSSIRETAPCGPLQFQHGLSILLRPTHFPRQQGRNRIPTVAAKIDDAGRAGLRERRREEESESSIEFFL